ncbi:family 20 glycosylhydrolase [uncultured Alistipes sp.]|uniref:glycoside hydrolase family 20 protein n=1 Tax=uncultured Alistipes sp. TaxID=538949 RepID=UPI0025E514C7|nr:family 20 glycosylhydrolase [uncultured Alistipes sp.]
MRFFFYLLLPFCGLIFTACGERDKTHADYRIIPKPEEIVLHDGKDFELNKNTRIVYIPASGQMQADAQFLAEYIQAVTGSAPETAGADAVPDGDNMIVLQTAEETDAGENYRIKVSAHRIDVEGGSAAGVFYGIQTLRKAMGAVQAEKVFFPAAVISDRPYLGYRGVMLDVARTFYPLEEVKRIIDLAALHNLNVFHWHLTDDQGWRIEIDAYPELITTGAFRRDTTLTGEPGTFGGYYTKQQIRDVVDYAARRHIQVIPEIDMPGHMMAALATYPELGCTGGPYVITSQPGVRRDILCPGNPATFEFVEKVLEEVIELFPSEYIHIGGDESPRTRWQHCPKCQALIRKAGLKSDAAHSAEDKLQGYFNTRIEEFLSRHHRRLIGWDEIVDGGMSPNATVMSWRGTAGGIKAANQGFNVIMSPNSSLYLDYYQSANIDTEPPTIGGYVPLKKTYDFEPVPDELSPAQARHIIGAQANVWSTYMRTEAILEHMMLPRLAALSEIAWSNKEKNFENFMTRLDRLTAFYERDNYNYFPYYYDITGSFVADYQRKAAGMSLTSLPGANIYYTLDGSEPTDKSLLYTDTVWIGKPASIRAVAILPEGRRSEPFREEVTFNKATMKPIKLLTTPHPKYGSAALNDGLRGKRVFTYGHWTGFEQEDMEAVIDLEQPTEISQVAFNALLDYGSHIMDASSARIWVSDDGKNFREVYHETYPDIPYGAVKRIINHKADFSPALTARYVKLGVARSRQLPEAFFDSHLQPFLFIDEIYVF